MLSLPPGISRLLSRVACGGVHNARAAAKRYGGACISAPTPSGFLLRSLTASKSCCLPFLPFSFGGWCRAVSRRLNGVTTGIAREHPMPVIAAAPCSSLLCWRKTNAAISSSPSSANDTSHKRRWTLVDGMAGTAKACALCACCLVLYAPFCSLPASKSAGFTVSPARKSGALRCYLQALLNNGGRAAATSCCAAAP